tara:strand:- start:59397 stop:61184 length:1788 start_codon:yes stop_codon:yes gene_type:complete
MTINLKIPDAMSELKPRITVFGVGGAGSNAVNNMIQEGLDGVEFVVANTDAQALAMSSAERRIQMGTNLTEGLGAGSQPKIGAAAAQEAQGEIIDYSAGSHMVFITAGMGGGTGTGAAPVIAQLCKEQDILTVAVVTKPFQFEGVRRMQIAEEGIEELGKYVDTLIVIPNQNLFRIANEKTTFSDAFAMADQVLLSGVSGVTDLMVKEGLINLDFADVKSIMQGMGKAMMGTGEASGEKRAIEAAEAAISNPLLDDVSMKGAQGLLISITGGEDLTLFEVDEVATRIRNEVDNNANIILGATFDSNLEGSVKVSVVATGIQANIKNIDSTNYTFDKKYTIPSNHISKDTMKMINKDINPNLVNTTPINKAPIAEKKYEGDISIKKIDANHSFFSQEVKPKPDIDGSKSNNLNNYTSNAKLTTDFEKNEIPRVSEFFSIKDENVSMAMNEQLLDRAKKKNKTGFFTKLVNGSFKKKDIEDESPLTDINYSKIELQSENETDKESKAPKLQDEIIEPQSNNELDQILEVDDYLASKNEIPNDIISDDNMEKNTQMDDNNDLLSMQDEQTLEFDNKLETSEGNDDDLEIPSFLKKQAN